ncbi:GGDEF domain-containing protein [bacterium]|nr:GGDEF domain-containing protein [bacterium]
MAVTSRRGDSAPSVKLAELSLELAQIQVKGSRTIARQIVQALSACIETNRSSLVLLEAKSHNIAKHVSVGYELKKPQLDESLKLIKAVCASKKPFFCYDIRETPDLLAPWADDYRTDAFILIPLVYKHQTRAVACVSNLSRQQLMQIENSPAQFELIISQLHQLVSLQLDLDEAEECAKPAVDDELVLIGNMIDKLDQTLDSRNIFSLFGELIADVLPLDLLAVIHDNLAGDQSGVVCVRRPSHQQDLSSIFDNLSRQWQRRHRRAPHLELEQAMLIGGELVSYEGECPQELALGRVETFPIFIDNDLFALVLISACEETLQERRLMRLFNILAHHLLMHVKKSLLLVQNQEMQTVDSLTGLYNERHFYHMMDREFDRAARYNVPLTILIIDVDHFKDVNEAYGFETGDMLLREISRILMENMRTTDFVSRYSGERFIIVLPETHNKNSEIMANRLRRYIENNSFYIPNTNVFIKVTVSIGVASYLDHKPTSLAQFIEFADTALYFAKRAGRNQVIGYSYVINVMMRETDNES